MNTSVRPLPEKWAKLFRDSPEVITRYATEHPVHLERYRIEDHDLSDSTITNARFEDIEWFDFVAIDSHFINTRFSGGSASQSGFSRSTFTNVVFEDMEFTGVEFIAAQFVDVTFKNCKIYNAKIHSLRTSKVTFENCDMANVEFFDSELDITLINTHIHEMGKFSGLKPGSRVTLKNSYIGPYSSFKHSHLASFTAVGSELEGFGLGETVDTVTLKNSKLDFTLGFADIGTLNVTDCAIYLLAHGQGVIKSASITDCKPSTRISFSKSKIAKLNVRNCPSRDFDMRNSSFGNLTVSHSDFESFDIHGTNTQELTLHNVTMRNEAALKNALADEMVLHNVTVAPGATLELTGSNIPLKR